MSNLRGETGAFALPGPDDAERETRHQVLATLLAAYADNEVPAETASQIDAHLLGCARCRREIDAHRALRLTLEQDAIPAASAALRTRILSGIAAAAPPQRDPLKVASDTRLLRGAASRGAAWWRARSRAARGALLLAGVATITAVGSVLRNAVHDARASATPQLSEVAVPSLPLFGLVLDDYRRVTAHDLPGRSRDLATVRQAVPFPVEALTMSGLRLLAAWTTDLDGEPAAVLAYRWRDQLVLQYVVSEQQLFRPSEVRRAFAGGRLLAARAGEQSMIAWPTVAGGALIVGELPVAELARVRAVAASPK